jgi:hypothetical protein
MKELRILSLPLALALSVALVGCSLKRAEPKAAHAESYGYAGDYAESEAPDASAPAARAESVSMRKQSARPQAAAPMVRGAPPPAPLQMGGEEQLAEQVAEESPAESRMVHYDGYARLRVGKLEEAADALVKLATEAGGRVEQLNRTRLVLRVPVDRFRDRFAAMLGVGDVLDKSITAQDVTEAFQSLELRLQSARAARERLQALLAKAKDEREKLMLIRELQRLAQEIDQLESQARLVADLASMSRITVDLVPREALVSAGPVPETSAFGWIRRLSPFRDEVMRQGKRLEIPVPTGMVLLDLKKHFVAETADGARIRASQHRNDPRGSADFWLDAIRQRLAPEFALAETRTEGAWKLLRLVDRSDKPYVFVLGVRVTGDKLDVVELYYPSEAQETRHAPAVRAALVGGGA